MQSLEVGFAGIFCCEMALKLAALGWYEYISSTANCFDGDSQTSGVVALVTLIDNEMRNHNDGIVRYVIAMRLARFLRLLGLLPLLRRRYLCTHAARCRQAAQGALCNNVRLLNTRHSALWRFDQFRSTIRTTERELDVWPRRLLPTNNFNDHASGMVVCFELLVVNNWHILMQVFYAVASNSFQKAMVRLFFIIVYVFGVLVCLNIVIAFSIDSYNDELEAYIDRVCNVGGSREQTTG